jgi:hypothetical protein
MFEPKRDEVSGQFRVLDIAELCDICGSCSIVRKVKSVRL